MASLRGLYILDGNQYELVYGPQQRQTIARHVKMIAEPQTHGSITRNPQLLREVEVIFGGWGMPRVDDAFVERAPRLKALFYAGGGLVKPPEAVRRGIAITTTHQANSQAVAEFCLGQILFSLKHGWRMMRQCRELRGIVDRNTVPGCYRTTVGLIGLGMIGRKLLKLLAPFELEVLIHDPTLGAEQAAELGGDQTSLMDLFQRSDVVSLHATLNCQTQGMITAAHLQSIKQGGTFINTARGGLVRHEEMLQVAKERHDVEFLLDVTDPIEPPRADSPLYELPNVVLTPHLAGAAGGELRRHGDWMVQELDRFVKGQPLRWEALPDDPTELAARARKLAV